MLSAIAIAVIFFGGAYVGQKAVHGVAKAEHAVVHIVKKPFHHHKHVQPWKRAQQ